MKLLSLLLLVNLLLGCASSTPLARVDTPLPPANLTQTCPNLPEISGADGESVLRSIIVMAQMYYACADMHGALVDAVLGINQREPSPPDSNAP